MASRNPRQTTGRVAAAATHDETPTFNVPDETAPEVVETPEVVSSPEPVATILPVDPPELPATVKTVSTFDEEGKAVPVEQLAAENPGEQLFRDDGTPVTITGPEAFIPLSQPEEDPDLVTVKILSHGVTAGGQVFLNGQVVQFHRKGDKYRSTLDTKGKSWLDLSGEDQIARWGEVKWRVL